MSLSRKSRLLLIAVTLNLAGRVGGPTVSMKSADRAAIKTVNVNSLVAVPKDMFFHGRAQAFAAGIGGALGAVAAQSVANEPKQIILVE